MLIWLPPYWLWNAGHPAIPICTRRFPHLPVIRTSSRLSHDDRNENLRATMFRFDRASNLGAFSLSPLRRKAATPHSHSSEP